MRISKATGFWRWWSPADIAVWWWRCLSVGGDESWTYGSSQEERYGPGKWVRMPGSRVLVVTATTAAAATKVRLVPPPFGPPRLLLHTVCHNNIRGLHRSPSFGLRQRSGWVARGTRRVWAALSVRAHHRRDDFARASYTARSVRFFWRRATAPVQCTPALTVTRSVDRQSHRRPVELPSKARDNAHTHTYTHTYTHTHTYTLHKRTHT